MYDVIVVGTDGSETASVAVNHAARLSRLTGATLHVVHAYQTVSTSHAAMATTFAAWSDDLDSANHAIAAAAEELCAQVAANAAAEGVPVVTYTGSGEPADLLIDVAKQVGANLVVVGNRGMTGARRFVLGSVPNKVSHHCPCSLLIVKTATS